MRASDYAGDLTGFLAKYRYQPSLTKALDGLGDVPFNQAIVNEIVLWKVDRYAGVNREVLQDIDRLGSLRGEQHRQAEPVLRSLLRTSGVDLPMASTILRFRNPQVFQVIDRHAYRAVYGSPYRIYHGTPVETKVARHFDYLDQVIQLCKVRSLDFESIDRVLYEFDKKKNGPLTSRIG